MVVLIFFRIDFLLPGCFISDPDLAIDIVTSSLTSRHLFCFWLPGFSVDLTLGKLSDKFEIIDDSEKDDSEKADGKFAVDDSFLIEEEEEECDGSELDNGNVSSNSSYTGGPIR